MRFRREEVKNILVVKLRAMGDTLLSLPSLRALKQGFPGARLAALVPDAAVEVVSGDPDVDEVIPYRRAWFNSLDHHLAVYRGLQDREFDLAVCLHASFRTALIGWMSGARWRSVRNHSGPDWFCNLPSREKKEPKSVIQRDFDALRALGLDPRDDRPRMALAPWAEARAGAFWRSARLGRRVLALLPGAGKPEKRWPRERFARLARSLSRRGWQVLWIEEPGASGGAPAGVRAASFASLQELGAVLKRAGRVLGNDSGPRHLAAACGARTFTLFGPESLREWHPYRREEGHWALKADSGRMRDLDEAGVGREVGEWLKTAK